MSEKLIKVAQVSKFLLKGKETTFEFIDQNNKICFIDFNQNIIFYDLKFLEENGRIIQKWKTIFSFQDIQEAPQTFFNNLTDFGHFFVGLQARLNCEETWTFKNKDVILESDFEYDPTYNLWENDEPLHAYHLGIYPGGVKKDKLRYVIGMTRIRQIPLEDYF